MKNLPLVIIIIFIAAGIVALCGTWYIVKQKELVIRAVEGCMTASTYTFSNDEGVTTVEPMKDPYERCMKEKGYR